MRGAGVEATDTWSEDQHGVTVIHRQKMIDRCGLIAYCSVPKRTDYVLLWYQRYPHTLAHVWL